MSPPPANAAPSSPAPAPGRAGGPAGLTGPSGPSGLSAAELEALVAAAGDAVLVLDAEGRCVRLGPCAPGLPAAARGALDALVGRGPDEVLPAAAARACRAAVAQALATGQPQHVAFAFPAGGAPRPVVAATLAPTRDATVVCVARRLAPRDAAAERLARRQRELRDTFEAAFDGMLVCGPDLRCLAANGALCAMLGRARPEVLGLDYPALLDPADLAERPLRLPELRAAGRVVTERRLLRADGSAVPAEVGTTLLEDGRVLFVVRDVTERKAAEAAVHALAFRDELTGLANRRGFFQAAEREWARAAREGGGVLAFAVDLDDLKPVNDAYGHAAGDVALVAAAEALRATFRHADVVARVGGDEFAALIVLAGPSTAAPPDAAPDGAHISAGGRAADRLRATADVIRARLAHHLTAADRAAAAAGRPALAVSLGLAHARPAAGSAAGPGLAALLAEADAALYADKRARKAGRARR